MIVIKLYSIYTALIVGYRKYVYRVDVDVPTFAFTSDPKFTQRKESELNAIGDNNNNVKTQP